MTNAPRNVRHEAYRRLTMNPRTPTASYSTIHAALAATAEHYGLAPTDVRVLVAVRDLGGRATSDQLATALMTHGSAIRRGLLALYAHKMVTSSTRGQRGVNADVEILAKGQAVIGTFDRFLSELHTHPDDPDPLAVEANGRVEGIDLYIAGAPA